MSVGIWQVVPILAIVLIIFGVGKLPRVMGDIAKGVKNFKSGLSEDQPIAVKPVSELPVDGERVVKKDEHASS